MICPVCQGSCNLVTFRYGRQYWPCPGCGVAGVLAMNGPAVIVCARFNTPVETKKIKKSRVVPSLSQRV